MRAQLGFAGLILVALAAALALSGPGGEAATAQPGAAKGSGSELDRAELVRISRASEPRVARRVERIRRLQFKRIPRPEVVSSEFLNRLGLREAERGPGGLGVGADDAFGQIIGLLGPDERLEAAYESTGDLAAAAYDPETKRLYVVSDAVVANQALVEFVLAHELDHALEDQRFGLPGSDGVNDDRALAETALIEGSATSVMVDYAARNLDPLELLVVDRRHRHRYRRRAEGIRRPAHLGLPRRPAVHHSPASAGGELEAGRLRARLATAGDHRADPAPPQVRARRAAVAGPHRRRPAARPRLAARRPQRVRRAADVPAARARDRAPGRAHGRRRLGRGPLRALAARRGPRRLRVPVPRRPRARGEVEVRHRRATRTSSTAPCPVTSRAGSGRRRPDSASGASTAATSPSPVATATRRWPSRRTAGSRVRTAVAQVPG